MTPYTLWILSEPLGSDVLLVAESADGALRGPFLARDDQSARSFLATNGMPAQILANGSTAVRVVREAEPRLFQVPASVLRPKELLGPLVKVLLRVYRAESGAITVP